MYYSLKSAKVVLKSETLDQITLFCDMDIARTGTIETKITCQVREAAKIQGHYRRRARVMESL